MSRKQKTTFPGCAIRAVVGGLFFTSLAMTGSAQAADTTEELIKLMHSKGMLTPAETSAFLEKHQMEKAAASPAGSAKPITVVPGGERYLQTISDNVARDIKDNVKQEVKNELRDEIARDIKIDAHTASVPDWTKRIRFGGDMRMRHQSEYYDQANSNEIYKPDKGTEQLNSTVDRSRERYRIRVGAKIKVNEQMEGEFKIATGNESDPVSTNDTLGDTFNKDTVTLDLGYVRWKPLAQSATWTGNAALTLGRMPNPFFSTDLVWDKDVNPEGAAMNLMIPMGPRFKGHLTTAAFSIQEVELSQHDKWLYGGQVGLEYSPRTTLNAQIYAAYYDYRNIEGVMNKLGDTLYLNNFTAPQFQQKGNHIFDINPDSGYKSALVMDYNQFNITAMVDVGIFEPIHVVFLADYVENLGYDDDAIFERTGVHVEEHTSGYQYGIAVGYPTVQDRWDWRLSLYYKYLEADAVLDAFTDSDFHGGGTNAKGWILGGDLGVYKNTWLATRWLSTTEIGGPPFTIDTLQIDLNVKF
jgi:hypothetical protein